MCGSAFSTYSNKAKYCIQCRKRVQYLKSCKDPTWRLSKLLAAAKQRSTNKELDFNIDLSFLLDLWNVQEGKCNLTGLAFDLNPWGKKGQVNPQAPSIDRIKPSLGYIKGNVRLITYHMNIALSDFGEKEFENLIKHYVKGKNIA